MLLHYTRRRNSFLLKIVLNNVYCDSVDRITRRYLGRVDLCSIYAGYKRIKPESNLIIETLLAKDEASSRDSLRGTIRYMHKLSWLLCQKTRFLQWYENYLRSWVNQKLRPLQIIGIILGYRQHVCLESEL